MKQTRRFTPLAWMTATALSTILLTADVTLGQNAPDRDPGERTTDQNRGQRGDTARGQRGQQLVRAGPLGLWRPPRVSGGRRRLECERRRGRWYVRRLV